MKCWLKNRTQKSHQPAFKYKYRHKHMNTNNKILNDAIDALKADDAVALKKHVTQALILKIRKAVKNKQKELAKKLFRNVKV